MNNVNNKFPVLKELEKVFHHFNQEFYYGRLIMPVHIIQVDKKVAVRYMSDSHCMAVGSKFSKCSNLELIEIYLHELVHLSNAQKRVVDVTTNQYHNKEFLAGAIAVGFHVMRHKTQGWSLTTFQRPMRVNTDYQGPTPARELARKKIIEGLDLSEEVLEEGRDHLLALSNGNKPRACFLKYVCDCPPPYNSVRSGRRPDSPHAPKITCQNCGSRFRMVPE